MKILLVVPDGVGIRNFLHSEFPDLLRDRGDVTVWHALPPEVVDEDAHPGLAWRLLPRFREGPAERILRQAKVFGQLHWRWEEDAGVSQLRFRPPPRRAVDRIAYHLGRTLGRAMASPAGLRRLDRWHARATHRAGYFATFRRAVDEERPDVVFCTHQRASRAVPALLAARAAGTPTATFVYSWDNLPKGRMAVLADHFLVWSEAMAEELLTYYPEHAGSQLTVTGTPQFEPYFRPIGSREGFLRRHGLDPARPVVLFSGDDKGTSPHDELYLEDLARGLAALPAEGRPQLLFRRCPVDLSGRHEPVLRRHPKIAVSEPLWRSIPGTSWASVAPMPEDLDLLAETVHHCDLVVNLASTMSLDFALFDKPGIYLAYDPAGAPPSKRGVDDLYRLPHFAPVHRHQPVYWARSADDLGPLVARGLAHPEEKREARSRWIDDVVARPLDAASRRCADALVALAGRTS